MKQKIYFLLCLLTLAVLVVINLQQKFHFKEIKPLKGENYELEKPDFTFNSYYNGQIQTYLENYQRRNFGFNEYFMRFYNQYLWDFYHKSYNGWIEIGKDDWLYESDFVCDHYESLMYKYASDTTEMKKKLDKTAEDLYKLQCILKEHNTYIFVNMIPGKDVIYPEYLPKNTHYTNPEGIHAYDYLKKRFDELGVNYVDNVAWFKQLKPKVDYPLFAKTGSHWSQIAAIYAFDSTMKYMEKLNGMKLANLNISEKYERTEAGPDDDLEQLINLLRPIKPNKFYNVDALAIPDSTADKPELITIGDSYFWVISYGIPLQDIFSKYPYWYYNSTIYFDTEHNSTKDIDLRKEICEADYVMLNYCTVQIYELGNGFIEQALALFDNEK